MIHFRLLCLLNPGGLLVISGVSFDAQDLQFFDVTIEKYDAPSREIIVLKKNIT
jgi:hypothetical protein